MSALTRPSGEAISGFCFSGVALQGKVLTLVFCSGGVYFSPCQGQNGNPGYRRYSRSSRLAREAPHSPLCNAGLSPRTAREQELGIGTLTSYDWIDLNTPEGYDRLVEVLDQEFDPKGIARRLKTQLTKAAKGVLIEHGYVDKDYRSTFYNFYTKKGRQYRPDCVRLHFFDGTVWYDLNYAQIHFASVAAFVAGWRSS